MAFTDKIGKYEFPKLGYIKIPKLPTTKEEKFNLGVSEDASSEDYLTALANKNFNPTLKKWNIPNEEIENYKQRLDFEINEINRLKFTDYILLVYNVIKFCNDNNILNSPSRGSCGGSLLLAVLGIVKLNPIKYGLLFERFVSAARTEIKEINGETYISSGNLADIDIDSQQDKKHLINEFLEKQFPGQTAAILTLNTLQGKSVLKEVLKSYEGLNEDVAKDAAVLIETKFGKVDSIKDSIKNNEKFKEWAAEHKESIDICCKLEGLWKNTSRHASGIIICDEPLENVIPLQLSPDKERITGFAMEHAQMFGTKLDNLGIKGLTAVHECLDLVGKSLEDIDVNDKSIYQFLNETDCFTGVFQAEEGLGRDVIRKIECKNINDIILSVSLNRPGCLKFIDEVCNAKKTGEKREIHPKLQEILKDNYNVMVFQEDLMKICYVMGGFNPLETNEIRKIIGKKLTDKMPKWKGKFIDGSIANGFTRELAEEVWQTFEDSGNYLFNRCLSPDSTVEMESGEVKMMFEVNIGDKIKTFNIDRQQDSFEVVSNIYQNKAELWEIELEDGRKIKCSMNHKLLCEDHKMRTVEDILIGKFKVLTD